MYGGANTVQAPPISWHFMPWRPQKGPGGDEPFLVFDHVLLRCAIRLVHDRYEARMRREGAEPADPPLSDHGLDVLVWNLLIRYGGPTADIDDNGFCDKSEETALKRLLAFQHALHDADNVPDDVVVCTAFNFFMGAADVREMKRALRPHDPFSPASSSYDDGGGGGADDDDRRRLRGNRRRSSKRGKAKSTPDTPHRAVEARGIESPPQAKDIDAYVRAQEAVLQRQRATTAPDDIYELSNCSCSRL